MSDSKTLVIFDIDGTLLFSNKIDSQCFADSYEEVYGKKFPTIDWRKYPHVTDHVIFNTVIKEHFGRWASADEILSFQNHFVNKIEEKRVEVPHEFMEVPNAQNLVKKLLSDERFAVGVGTGGWLAPAKVKLKHVGIPHEEIHLSAADNQPTRVHIVNTSIEKAESAHGKFERIVYVGDAIWDVETTREMNIPFIGIRREADFEVLQSAGAELVFQDYSQEEEFFDAIFSAVPPK